MSTAAYPFGEKKVNIGVIVVNALERKIGFELGEKTFYSITRVFEKKRLK